MRNYFLLTTLFCSLFTSVSQGQTRTVKYPEAQLKLIDNVKVASLDPGVVTELHVQPGITVKEGDVLVDLDRDIYRAEAESTAIQLEIAKQEYKNDINLRYAKKSTAVNQKRLQKSENAVREFKMSISETEIDRLRLEADQSALSFEQAQLERDVAKLTVDLREEEKAGATARLSRRTIVSPIDGLVVEMPVQKGEAVGTGQTICRVIGMDKLRVKGFFSAKEFGNIRSDSTAFLSIEINGENVQIPAKIFFTSPEVKTREQDFEVWADVDNKDRKLLPGLKGTFLIEIDD